MTSRNTSRSEERDTIPEKGVVRPLADSISIAEAERASQKVREAVAEQVQQRSELKRFFDENESLSNLVLQLSDTVSHRIMVPFGKAAFFPGRLKHTNEFLVLLGENHYAERSAKQTAEILNRRSQFLQRQIENVDAHIADLEAESSFASSAAEEAKAGLVEIREYLDSDGLRDLPASAVQGSPSQAFSSRDGNHVSPSDDEHERLMARLSELELAETAAGDQDEDSDEEGNGKSKGTAQAILTSSIQSGISSLTRESVDHNDGGNGGFFASGTKYGSDGEYGSSEDSVVEDEEESDYDVDEIIHDKDKDADDKSEGASDEDNDALDEDEDENAVVEEVIRESKWAERPPYRPLSRFARDSISKNEDATSQHSYVQRESATVQGNGRFEAGHSLRKEGEEDEGSGFSAPSRSKDHHTKTSGQSKAFTGQVTEHNYKEQLPIKDQQAANIPSTRPVSKFKLRQAQGGST